MSAFFWRYPRTHVVNDHEVRILSEADSVRGRNWHHRAVYSAVLDMLLRCSAPWLLSRTASVSHLSRHG